jgi:hypothetical protein
MAKMTRERKVKEKRQFKQEKKEAKKLAAAMGPPEDTDGMFSEIPEDGEDAEAEPLGGAPEAADTPEAADVPEDPAVS